MPTSNDGEIKMNKEDILLKSYSVLAKDPKKNSSALKSAIQQLIEINPKIGIKCWEECIRNNLSEIETDFGKKEFSNENVGRILVWWFERVFCSESSFAPVLKDFSKNNFLLEVLYTKSPIATFDIYGFSGPYVISYLIRKNRLQEANNVLSAIYKNKTFTEYSELWDRIIDKFRYGNNYAQECWPAAEKLPDNTRNFCMGWIERIKDEEEQAGAMTFAMQMF